KEAYDTYEKSPETYRRDRKPNSRFNQFPEDSEQQTSSRPSNRRGGKFGKRNDTNYRQRNIVGSEDDFSQEMDSFVPKKPRSGKDNFHKEAYDTYEKSPETYRRDRKPNSRFNQFPEDSEQQTSSRPSNRRGSKFGKRNDTNYRQRNIVGSEDDFSQEMDSFVPKKPRNGKDNFHKEAYDTYEKSPETYRRDRKPNSRFNQFPEDNESPKFKKAATYNKKQNPSSDFGLPTESKLQSKKEESYGGQKEYIAKNHIWVNNHYDANNEFNDLFGENGMRLNKYVANAGVCARRKADELIAKGSVQVNGKVVVEMGHRVMPSDTVTFEGRVLNPEPRVYVLLNKPKNYITTTDDERERHTVMELVSDASPYRLYPVGRLDRDTTGLLLLTNDGELAQKLAHPSKELRKVYQITLDKPIAKKHLEQIAQGVELEDGLVPIRELECLNAERTLIELQIHIGRNRVVRRLFEHLGYQVVKLDRVAYGGLTKKGIERGKWRYLNPKEIIFLKYKS
ncbi:MAG: rRNA pseudouridine synthase, partial [Chitinophagales bacterium]|nr:rRNA pseudouridine synthase [Chitinophagales bacterium]